MSQSGRTPEDFELELDDDFQEENVKNEETGNNQTWNIGILSNFIRQNVLGKGAKIQNKGGKFMYLAANQCVIGS